MVTLNLYKVSCDPHTVDKTDYITETAAVTGTIRGDLDVQRPIIDVEGDVSGYNYAELNDRYYHIDSCNRLRTGLSVVRMSVDVLWTYKDAIYTLPAVASRSYRLVNAYLPDDQQRVRQYTQCNNHNIGDPLDYILSGGYCHIVVTVG
jgi:hypothetical protein